MLAQSRPRRERRSHGTSHRDDFGARWFRSRSATGDHRLDKVGFAALTILALAGAGMPAACHAGDPLYIPHRRGEPSALSPDPSGTAATALPGERLSQDEADARIGWLVLTHIMDVRAALRRDHVEEAADKLARARAAVRNLEKRLDGRSHGLALPSSLSASLVR